LVISYYVISFFKTATATRNSYSLLRLFTGLANAAFIAL
jgi:hypothetical protein